MESKPSTFKIEMLCTLIYKILHIKINCTLQLIVFVDTGGVNHSYMELLFMQYG